MYREKCLMVIKEEPASPGVGVRVQADGMVPGNSCGACMEPPVLPISVVESVLEGRSPCIAADNTDRRGRRIALERTELPNHMENIEMSLDGLHSLLGGQQYSLEHSTIMDVSTGPSRPLCIDSETCVSREGKGELKHTFWEESLLYPDFILTWILKEISYTCVGLYE
uniref:Vertebrate heat shock transcription factor C-terminal domain-containing protein n=1 Tax=Callorhinchus milii TaxID=7868 RepID=A0A4W3HYH5_CALMI